MKCLNWGHEEHQVCHVGDPNEDLWCHTYPPHFFLAQIKMSWRSPLTSQYSR